MRIKDLDERGVDAIVIGASAGGVEALSKLLPALSASTRVPVLVVLHIPRDRPSRLAELFAAKCAMRVREAEDKMPVEPGTVYFAPPDYHMLVDEGPCIALSADELVHFSRPSIDVLFESASDAYGERLLGIILTGANEDGTSGIETIHQAGGVALVQEPEGAHSPQMLTSAIERTPELRVLSLERIAELFRASDRWGRRVK